MTVVAHLDEDFVLLGPERLDLFDSQNLRRPVPVVDDGSHARASTARFAAKRWVGAVLRQDDVSRLLAGLDVLRCLDHVLERVAPVDDPAELPGFDELLDDEDVLLRVLG